jgi:ecotin
MRTTAIATLLLLHGAALASDDLKAFPPPAPGMVRWVLRLPALADESTARVELLAGKTVKVDAVNRYFFGGSIRPETIEGWGYTRWIVSALGPMGGTLVAVPPEEPRIDRFVALGGEPVLVRYSSRVPIVVYAPEGVEVRYRIWSAGGETRPMEKG